MDQGHYPTGVAHWRYHAAVGATCPWSACSGELPLKPPVEIASYCRRVRRREMANTCSAAVGYQPTKPPNGVGGRRLSRVAAVKRRRQPAILQAFQVVDATDPVDDVQDNDVIAHGEVQDVVVEGTGGQTTQQRGPRPKPPGPQRPTRMIQQ